MRKRIFTILLCLLMLLFAFPVSAADEAGVGSGAYGPVSFSQEQVISLAASGADEVRYYAQLDTAIEREFFNLFSRTTPGNPSFTYKFTTMPKVPAGTPSGELADFAKAYLNELVEASLGALILDDPLFFWASGYNYNFTYYYNNKGFTSLEVTCTVKSNKGVTASTYASELAKLKAAAEAVPISANACRYDQLREMYIYLIKNNVYDLDAPHAHSAYGALVDGRTVCEGYAYALKMLCDRMHIPCVVIVGFADNGSGTGYDSAGHVWNAVQMDNGKWYAIDATWGDMGSYATFSYFLIGSDSATGHRNGLLFSQSHVAGVNYFHYSPAVFETVTLSKTEYPRPRRRAAYDINGDGQIDGYDTVWMMQCLAGLRKPSSAADPDGDGKFTSYDATVLLQYVSGMLPNAAA